MQVNGWRPSLQRIDLSKGMATRVLVIAAHPDDEVLGCGGAIARHVENGSQVYVLIATRGAPDVFPSAQVETVWQEAHAAHEMLGITETYTLDFLAPRLDVIPTHELVDSIHEHLIQLRPEIVYLPHRGDIHNDHRCVYHATLVAARPIDNCGINRLLCYETPSETEWAPPSGDNAFVPTVFVDISRHLEIKLRAVACYRSQIKEPPHPRSLRTVEIQARLRGSTVGLSAAEAFMLVREIVK